METNAYHGAVPVSALEAGKRIKLAVYIRVTGLALAFFLPVVSYAIYWVVIIYYVMIGQLDVSPAEERAR
jgi:hypothetical protein